MLKYKCGNCGGEFEIHTHGELQCPFCGTKQYFSDAELAGYKGYRDNVLQYVRSCNDVLFEKGDVLHLWRDSDTAVFSSRYQRSTEENRVRCIFFGIYGNAVVVVVFEKRQKHDIQVSCIFLIDGNTYIHLHCYLSPV